MYVRITSIISGWMYTDGEARFQDFRKDGGKIFRNTNFSDNEHESALHFVKM